jgi:hypothetical protein
MNEEQAIELGRRAVACKGWRWLPGMLARYGDGAAWHRLTDGDGYGLPFKHRPPNPRDAWPDLRDPATLGCLLALVREAYPGCAIWVARDCVVDPLDDTEYMLDERERWTVCGGSNDDYLAPYGSGPTEAAALVAALDACNGA